MHTIVREIIERYLETKILPTIENIKGFQKEIAWPTESSMIFVTLYHGGEIIASAGTIQPRHQDPREELLDSTLSALRDDRLMNAISEPDDLKTTQIRVDIIPLSKRQVVARITDIDPKNHGAMILSQNYLKAAILLPNITNIATTSDEIFFLLTKKAGLDAEKITTSDYTLYKIESEKYSDF
jgi:hypothetical protein